MQEAGWGRVARVDFFFSPCLVLASSITEGGSDGLPFPKKRGVTLVV